MTSNLRDLSTRKKQKIPTEPGYYWAKWRIADEYTNDEDDRTPSNDWEIVKVVQSVIDIGLLVVVVPGVTQAQDLENFFWGDQIKPPP